MCSARRTWYYFRFFVRQRVEKKKASSLELYWSCCSTPQGLEDVSKYPQLLAALLEDPSWREEDLKKLAGLNLLRVFRTVEEVSSDSSFSFYLMECLTGYVSN